MPAPFLRRVRTTLTVRLVAVMVLAQLALAVGLVCAGVVFARRELTGAFNASLQGQLMSVAALVRYQGNGPQLVFDTALLPPGQHLHPDFYQVRGPDGTIVASSFPPGVAAPPRGRHAGSRFWNFRLKGLGYRGWMVTRLPILDNEADLTGPPARLDVYYAASTRQLHEEVATIGFAIAGVSLALLILTSLGASAMVRRELEPLRDLAQEAAAISPSNWEFHPDPGAPAELGPLIAALRGMLDRLHASHRQQREFLADAAHQLKTPVAILKSTWQSLLRRPRTDAEYRAAAEATLSDIERLEQLLQRMLRLARSEQDRGPNEAAGGSASLPRVDVAATCQAALDRMRPLARAKAVTIVAQGCEQPIWVRAEADDLEQVWVNLLENAVEHTPAGGNVEIACGRATGSHAVEVRVRDQGAGVEAEEAGLIFDRFHRGPSSRTGGFGLGLAIARAVAERYDGSIELVAARGAAAPESATGFGGAEFRVSFPAAD